MTRRDGWLDYWDGDVSVYTGERHLRAHYQELLTGLRPLMPPAPFTLLDYGCGEALMAPELVRLGGKVILYDKAAGRRARLRERHSAPDGVVVPDDLEPLDGLCDMVLLISVTQYLPKGELPQLLRQLRRALRPGGRLLVGDVPAPGNTPFHDAAALLAFAWRGGFLADAVRGLLRTIASNYHSRLRELGLSTYDEAEMLALLAEAGFDPRPLERNVGHARHRRSYLAVARS